MTSSATATLPQMAIAEFLAEGCYDHHIRKLRKLYCEQTQRMSEAVTRYFPAGTKATRPTGGQILWVELPKKIDALELYRRALREKISIAPGPLFSPKQAFPNFIRLNSGNPWSDVIENAMIKLGQLMAALE